MSSRMSFRAGTEWRNPSGTAGGENPTDHAAEFFATLRMTRMDNRLGGGEDWADLQVYSFQVSLTCLDCRSDRGSVLLELSQSLHFQ